MSYDNLTFSIETITPDDASRYLESNVENNRPISDRPVSYTHLTLPTNREV